MTTDQRKFGVGTLTFLVVANMIGAGVFTTSGFALQDLGSPERVVAAWLVGGLIALCGSYSYGLLVRQMPESGGEYLFLSRAAHPLLGFIAGWVSLIAGFTGAIAFAATAFESYFLSGFSVPPTLPPDTLAIAAVVGGGLSHGIHGQRGAIGQNLTVALKLILLVVFLIIAGSQLATRQVTITSNELTAATGWAAAGTFAVSLVWISLSYSGFNAAIYVAGEADRPMSVVPRAMLLGTLITTLLYVALNAIFVYGAPAEQIAGQPEVATIAARAIGGARLEAFVRIVICLALITSVLSMMMAAPRVYAKMAADGLMPRCLAHGVSDSPRAATFAQVLLAVVIIKASQLRELIGFLGLTLSLSAAISVCCLFLPRQRQQLTRSWQLILPAIYIASTFAAGLFMALRQPMQFAATLATVAIGALMYAVAVRIQ